MKLLNVAFVVEGEKDKANNEENWLAGKTRNRSVSDSTNRLLSRQVLHSNFLKSHFPRYHFTTHKRS